MIDFKNFMWESTNNIAKDLKNVKWKTSIGVASFKSKGASYGVLNADGMALSADGVKPVVYHSMKIAKEMAQYADGFKDHSWIKLLK